MKLRIAGYDLDIEYYDSNSALLLIEDNKMFSKIVNNIYLFCKENQSSELLFLDNNDSLVPSKKVQFIDSIYSIDINARTILSKLYTEIKGEFEDNDLEYSMLKQGIDLLNQSLINTLSSYNVEFDYKSEVEVEDVLKMFGLKVEDSKISVFEKIISIIEIYSEIFPDYSLIFINILNYLDEKEVEEVLKYIRYKKSNSLFIEYDYKKSLSLRKYVIDEEFDLYLDTIQNDR